MRILMVIDSLTSGGAQRQMVTLGIGLVARGHTVEQFTYHPKDYFSPLLKTANIHVHNKLKTGRFSVIHDLRKLLKTHSYDIVLSFLHGPNLYSELACLFHKKPALVVSERGTYSPGIRGKIKYLFQMHRLADHITVNSHAQAQEIVKLAPWLKNKITTIYNGLDLAQFHPPQRSLASTNGSIKLLSVGFIAPRKNPLTLIRALKLYLNMENAHSISIDWAGRIGEQPVCKELYQEAVELLDNWELNDYWQWLGEQDNMPALYPKYDGLVHPSYREGLCNAIVEAMACGLPVLAGNVFENPRLITDGERGFLFDPASAEDLAQTIQQFVKLTPNQRHEMGTAARYFVENNLTVELLVEKYETLFQHLTAKK